jgi:hypothetical protein
MKKVTVTGMLAFALFALIAPQKAQAQYDFIKEANWDRVFENMSKKYTSVTDIIPGDSKKNTWKCNRIIIIAQRKDPNRDNDPATRGGLIDRAGKRRYPKTDKEPENISLLRGKGNQVIVELNSDAFRPLVFVTFRDVEWYKPNAQLRLFKLAGHIKINEDKDGEISGFTLVNGSLWEDKNVKSNAAYDEVMSMYA